MELSLDIAQLGLLIGHLKLDVHILVLILLKVSRVSLLMNIELSHIKVLFGNRSPFLQRH